MPYTFTNNYLLLTTTEVAAKNPELLKRTLAVLREADGSLGANKDKAVEWTAKAAGMKPETLKAVWSEMEFGTKAPDAKVLDEMQAFANFAVKNKMVKEGSKMPDLKGLILVIPEAASATFGLDPFALVRVGRIFLSLASLSLFCIVWEAGSRTGLISNRLIPAPSQVAEAAWELLGDGILLRDIYWSSRRALSGMLLGSMLGIVVGLFTGRVPAVRLLLEPVIQVLRPIPGIRVDSVRHPVVRRRRGSEALHHLAGRVLPRLARHARRRDGHALAIPRSGGEPRARAARALLSRCAPRSAADNRHRFAPGTRDCVHSRRRCRVDRRVVGARQPDFAIASHFSHRSHARRACAAGRARGHSSISDSRGSHDGWCIGTDHAGEARDPGALHLVCVDAARACGRQGEPRRGAG
jgi:hypothetical protein